MLNGEQRKLVWLKTILANQQWEIQKVLLSIITVIALGLAALRSTLVFERMRDKLLDDAKEQREKLQKLRLERIKRQRKAEAEALIKARKREAERQKRMRFSGEGQ